MRVRVRREELRPAAAPAPVVLPDGMEPLMGIGDLASFLGVPVATVRKWNHEGTGPRPVRVGRYVKYQPADVRRWLEERRRAG